MAAKGKGKAAVTGSFKLQCPAGEASPKPPIGPALGQRGINIMEFCKAFNDQSKDVERGMPLPTIVTQYSDRSFSFEIKSPPASVLIRKALKLEKGSSTPNTAKVGVISREQLEKIAAMKMKDLSATSVDAAVQIIAGTARSMGVNVSDK